METENTEKVPFEIRSSKEAVYGLLDNLLKQVAVGAQKDLDKLKEQVEGIANVIRFQHEQSNKSK